MEINSMELWLKNSAGSEHTEATYRVRIQSFLAFFNTSLDSIVQEWHSISSYEEEKAFNKRWDLKLKQYGAYLKIK